VYRSARSTWRVNYGWPSLCILHSVSRLKLSVVVHLCTNSFEWSGEWERLDCWHFKWIVTVMVYMVYVQPIVCLLYIIYNRCDVDYCTAPQASKLVCYVHTWVQNNLIKITYLIFASHPQFYYLLFFIYVWTNNLFSKGLWTGLNCWPTIQLPYLFIGGGGVLLCFI